MTVLLFIFLMIICGIYFAVINKWERRTVNEKFKQEKTLSAIYT